MLKEGDVLIQRGIMHAWKNPSTTVLCHVKPSSQGIKGESLGINPWKAQMLMMFVIAHTTNSAY